MSYGLLQARSDLKQLEYKLDEYPNRFLSPEQVASYVIFIDLDDGNSIKAKNGRTGKIDYSGTDARTVINSAIDALTDGGTVLLREGTYELTDALAIPNTAYRITLRGSGRNSTVLKQNTAGKNVITISPGNSYPSLVEICDLTLQLPSSGSTGHGIACSPSSGQYGVRYSVFRSLTILNGDSIHWSITITNPLNCSFENIRCEGMVNGIQLLNNFSTNQGNSIFTNIGLCPKNGTNGMAIKLDSVTGTLNFLTFQRFGIWAESTTSGSKGIELGATAAVRYVWFRDANIERMDTGIDLINSQYAYLDKAMLNVKGSTLAGIRVSVNALRSVFRDINIEADTDNVGTGFLDQNTNSAQPTILDDVRIGNFSTRHTLTKFTRLHNFSTNVPTWLQKSAINRVAGVTPTLSTFDTNPPSPANMTDEDFTTWSGEGVKTRSSNGDIGIITFDMGATYPVLVVAHLNVHKASGLGAVRVLVESSDDNNNFYQCGTDQTNKSADAPAPILATFLYARYFRLRFVSTGTTSESVYHVNVAEIQALELYSKY